jgi:hypothetical protein
MTDNEIGSSAAEPSPLANAELYEPGMDACYCPTESRSETLDGNPVKGSHRPFICGYEGFLENRRLSRSQRSRNASTASRAIGTTFLALYTALGSMDDVGV